MVSKTNDLFEFRLQTGLHETSVLFCFMLLIT